MGEKHGLSYPGSACNNQCILYLRCPDTYYVKITIQFYLYTGSPHSQCNLWGNAIYDNNLGGVGEQMLLCNKYSYFISGYELPA